MKKLMKWLLGLLALVFASSVSYCEGVKERQYTKCLNERQALTAMTGISPKHEVDAQERRVLLACGHYKKASWTWT